MSTYILFDLKISLLRETKNALCADFTFFVLEMVQSTNIIRTMWHVNIPSLAANSTDSGFGLAVVLLAATLYDGSLLLSVSLHASQLLGVVNLCNM